jgi:hypothetical protein
MENELVKVINESGLDKSKAQVLLDNFSNFFEIAADWENKAKSLTVNSIEQKAEMKMAREGRLFLKEKRVSVEKTRKQLKENSLREGQTIDAIAKILTNLIVPIENDLEQKEKFAEIKEAERKAALKIQREIELSDFMEFVPYGLDFSIMDEENYQKVLSGAKLQFQARIEQEKKDLAEKIAKENVEAEERERIRLENERLKKEAEQKAILEKKRSAEMQPYLIFIRDYSAMINLQESEYQKELSEIKQAAKLHYESEAKKEAERKAIEGKARKEAEKAAIERAKLLAEIKAKEEAEQKAKKEEEERVKAEKAAEKKAAKAPDNTKLLILAKEIEFYPLPVVKTEEAKEILKNVESLLKKISLYINQKVNE